MSRSFAETSRAMKMALFVSSVLGLLVGLTTGVPEGKALAVRLFALRTRAIERELSAFSAAQFQHADPEHARQAVLSEIRTLEALQHLALPLPPNPSRAKRDSQDLYPENLLLENQALYIAYARLAMIEDAAGHAAAAAAARAKAAEQWRALHPSKPDTGLPGATRPGAEITSEGMKRAVREFDNQAADVHSSH